jgi:hypothetical protein
LKGIDSNSYNGLKLANIGTETIKENNGKRTKIASAPLLKFYIPLIFLFCKVFFNIKYTDYAGIKRPSYTSVYVFFLKNFELPNQNTYVSKQSPPSPRIGGF